MHRYKTLRGFRRASSGFTLLEVMIASSMLLVVVGLSMNFLFGLNRSGNEMIEQAGLEEQLRNSLNRFERETIEGALVLEKDSSTNCGGVACETGPHTLVLAVPIYTRDGFLLVNDTGKPLTDTITIRSVTDPKTTLLTNRNPDMPPDRLLFSIAPNARSNRVAITDQTIAKDLMPKEANHYKFPDSFGTEAIAKVDAPTFTFYQEDGTPIDASSTDKTLLAKICQIKVVLWAEKDYGPRLITARKEIDVRLRNWRK